MSIDTKQGGKWLGAARSWLQWHTKNGDSVTWGSSDEIHPTMNVRMVEELAADVAIAAVAEFLEKHEMLLKAAYHLLMNAQVNVPGGPTDWEFTKKMWFSKYKNIIKE